MQVLIVESATALAEIWARHLTRAGFEVTTVSGQGAAITALCHHEISLVIMNLDLPGESSLAVADFASYRRPDARVIFVTASTFFSDGSIFQHVSNACACVSSATQPDDLAAMVSHYGLSA